MYYEGAQLYRPGERPFALHRNGYAGMARYAAFLWSGDVYSTWETLRTHVAVAINTGLSGIPFWGTDIGGFVPTPEYTGELHVRWFQFGAFCPLFRAHGRTWHLRLPWGWNTGELGPNEVASYRGGAGNPDPSELHNARVEPICKTYLALRYRLMPYLYTAVRETHDTGLPIVRALWLHYPNDRRAAATSICGAGTFSWRPSSSRVRSPAASISLKDRGTTSGPRSRFLVGARSPGLWTSRRCPCTCAPDRSFRWDPSSSIPPSRSTIR